MLQIYYIITFSLVLLSELLHRDNAAYVCDFYLCPLPQYGFNMVMSHPHAVNEIALSLNNRNPRLVHHKQLQVHKELQTGNKNLHTSTEDI